MFMMLLVCMTAAAPAASAANAGHDVQQVAIDTVTGKSEPKPVRADSSDDTRRSADLQVEIANRLTGRNVTYPKVSSQNGMIGDMQSEVAHSVGGSYEF